MSETQYQGQLFAESESNETVVIKRDGLDIKYLPNFVDAVEAEAWFQFLLQDITWRQDVITVYGKRHLTPRLSCWMGETWMSYRYSQHTMSPCPWQELPMQIKKRVEAASNEHFNSVLINYYRDGRDSNGWHSDDEPELGPNPSIASLTLGAARDFQLREKSDHSNKLVFNLAPGSLLLMRGTTQSRWQHQVPKRKHAEARINLTFRQMLRSSA